jgi:uncharacterized protein (TIGR03437 family)
MEGGVEDATPRDALEYNLMRRLPEGASELSPDLLAQARQQISRMPKVRMSEVQPTAAALSWTPVGPGNIGGRTRSFLIHPQDPNIMYAGAVTGGIWKTADGGQNWSLLTDPTANITVGAMAMDWSNPSVIYAGTGEIYQGYLGQGIYKSTNGNTFVPLANTLNSNFSYVNRLAIGHSNPLHVYAATTTGLWASMDGGATWTRQLSVTTNNGCDDVVSRSDKATDYLFASCAGKLASDGYIIYRNIDAGGSGTWSQVLSDPAMARTSLAIAPSLQSTVYAIASSNGKDSSNYKDGLQAVWRSQSNGDSGSWTVRTSNADPNLINTSVLSAPFCTARSNPERIAWYANFAAVDPTNPDRLWAGSESIYRSDDGGANWNYVSISSAHVDNHVIAFHPAYDGAANQTLFLGDDGGLYRTDNGVVALTGTKSGCTGGIPNIAYPTAWKSLNNSFVATQFYNGTAFPGGGAYFGGTQDNGQIRGGDSSGLNGWSSIYGGDGGYVAIDPADASTLYMDNNSMSFHKSTDGAASTPVAMNGIPSAETGLFEVPFAIDPNDGAKVWLGAQSALYRTVDGAANWTVGAPQPDKGVFVSAVAVSPFDPNAVIFGTTNGKIYRSGSALTASASTTWSSTQPRSGYVSWMAFDPNIRGAVYAAYSTYRNGNSSVSHIYKSSDGGQTWSGIDGSGAGALADIPVNTILVDPKNSLTLYVGTDNGVFITQDGGVTWAHDQSPFSNAIVNTLALDRPLGGSTLFAFTFGRGVWKVPLAGAPVGCSYSASPTTVNAPAVGGLYAIHVTAGSGCAWVVTAGQGSAFAAGQGPSSGTGSGTAVVSVTPNLDGDARGGSVVVAGTVVNVSQAATSLVTSGPGGNGSDEYIGITARTLPFTGLADDTRTLTSNPSDPTHSCSNSADYKTAWWLFTASASGMMEITVQSERWDAGGNAGFVVTAYPAGSINTQSELGCAVVARDLSSWAYRTIRVPVSSGSQYVVEVSATGNTANDGGYTLVFAAMGVPDFNLSVSPTQSQINPGATLQFTASNSSSLNQAVRWSASAGVISPTGLYTAPASVSQTTNVTITATAFADTNKKASASVSVTAPKVTAPVISVVENGGSFLPGFSQGSWVTIKGTNLAVNNRLWTGADFAGDNLPTQLDGTSVTIDGKPAYVYYISPGQVNVLAPADAAVGSVPVQVSYQGVPSNVINATESALSPALFMFDPQGQKYVAAVRTDGAYMGPAGLFGNLLPSVPAHPGNVILLYGTGFGPTLPATPIGTLFNTANSTTNKVTATIGGVPATVQFAGLVVPGEYQFNILVPNVPAGDQLVVLTVGGITTQANAYLAVQ